MRIRNYLLIAIFAFLVGLFIRMDDYIYWKKHQQLFFTSNGLPILTGMDGYKYALESKLILQKWKTNGFTLKEFLRVNANGISKVTAVAETITREPPEKVSVWLSPILASLLALPLVILGCILESTVVGALSALSAVISPIYIIRSSICWLDTDILNLMFPCIMSLSIFAYYNRGFVQKVICTLLFLASAYGWIWWYKHGFLVFLWIILFILILILDITRSVSSLRHKTNLNTKLSILLSASIIFCILIWAAQHSIEIERSVHRAYSLLVKYSMVINHPEIRRPYVPISPVSELQKPTLLSLSTAVSGNLLFFILSIIGLLKMMRRSPLLFLTFTPFIILGIVCIKGGIRFSLFLVPAFALGLSYFIDTLRILTPIRSRNRLMLFCILIIIGNYTSVIRVAKPVISPGTAEAMTSIKKVTPKNSIILTWWDLGYPIQYYSERATFTSGGRQNPYLIYLTALTFSATIPTNSEKFALLMLNSTKRRLFFKRLKQYKDPIPVIYSIGKIPKPSKPVYIFINDYIAEKIPVICMLGTWSFILGKGHKCLFIPMSDCNKTPKSVICDRVRIDLLSYTAHVNGENIPIKEAVVVKKDKTLYRKKGNPSGVIWIVVEQEDRLYSFLVDNTLYKTTFARMFFTRKHLPGLSIVMDRFPFGILYKVEPEQKYNQH